MKEKTPRAHLRLIENPGFEEAAVSFADQLEREYRQGPKNLMDCGDIHIDELPSESIVDRAIEVLRSRRLQVESHPLICAGCNAGLFTISPL